MVSDLAIEALGLTKRFGSSTAVEQVDLRVPAGDVYAVLGTNGAGKTTTIKMLATLLRPDSGSARIFGHDVVQHATVVRGLIGLTGQYASVDEDLTAVENLMVFGRLIGSSRKTARARAHELLEEFGLSHVADRQIRQFSGGMRRRVDLAASLITRPRLLFLDEPTTGLDPRTRAQMWGTIRTMVAAGSTVLLTTQYLDEADELAARVAVMDRGRVVAEGTTDELKAKVGEKTVALTPRDPEVATRIAAICRTFADTETRVGAIALEGPENVVRMPMPDIDRLPDLLLELRAQGCGLASVNVEQPSLDEVFFALTEEISGEAVA